MGGTDELVFHNPMQILDEETAYIENMRYLGNFYATFKYKDKFAFKSSVNTDITQIYDYTYYNENHPYGKGVGRSSITTGRSRISSWRISRLTTTSSATSRSAPCWVIRSRR